MNDEKASGLKNTNKKALLEKMGRIRKIHASGFGVYKIIGDKSYFIGFGKEDLKEFLTLTKFYALIHMKLEEWLLFTIPEKELVFDYEKGAMEISR